MMTTKEEHFPYYIVSQGPKLAWIHLHDWLVLVFLMTVEGVLNKITPFYRFVGKDMMTDLKYPLKPNTVPIWAVPLYAVLLPILIFLVYYFRRRNVYDLHNATLGLLYAVLITAVITDSVKAGVGRPRPNFFWRCFPDGKDLYDVLGNVICHGETSVIKEGHKSFPSGHTSWSFAGLGFLSLYLSGKIRICDQKGHIAKLCIVVAPILAAALVAVSRVDDYWHHWQDVFAGGLLGFGVALFCYHQFFPPPYHQQGWWPHAYLYARKKAAEELENERKRSTELDIHVLDPDSSVLDRRFSDQPQTRSTDRSPVNGLSNGTVPGRRKSDSQTIQDYCLGDDMSSPALGRRSSDVQLKTRLKDADSLV